MNEALRRESLHIYRHLLREATYVPDPKARAFIRETARARFEKARKRARTLPFEDNKRWIKQHCQIGRHNVNILVRANKGEYASLSKLLKYTYGRVGPVKHELMTELRTLKPGELGVDQAGAEAEEASVDATLFLRPGKSANKDKVERPDPFKPQSPRFWAVLKNQVLNNPPLSDQRIRSVTPKIPELNAWRRPMPLVRVKNMQMAHWKKIYEALLPPLPLKEWRRLQALASGYLPIDFPPKRTKIGEDEEAEEMTRHKALSGPIQMAVSYRKLAYKHTRRHGTLESGRMRSIYSHIWAMSPLLRMDERTKRWTAEYGKHRSPAARGDFTKPRPQDAILFQGAEPPQPSKEKEKKPKKEKGKKAS